MAHDSNSSLPHLQDHVGDERLTPCAAPLTLHKIYLSEYLTIATLREGHKGRPVIHFFHFFKVYISLRVTVSSLNLCRCSLENCLLLLGSHRNRPFNSIYKKPKLQLNTVNLALLCQSEQRPFPQKKKRASSYQMSHTPFNGLLPWQLALVGPRCLSWDSVCAWLVL